MKLAFIAVIAVIAVSASGCLVSRAEPDCAGATSCEDCRERSGCGFCDGRCMAGTSLGPDVGGCEDWFFEDCSFGRMVGTPAPSTECLAATCDGCLAESGCRWCEGSFASGFCSDEPCSTGYDYLSRCPQPCGSYGSCSECAADPQCEYCWDYRISDRTTTERCTDIYSCRGAEGYCISR